MRYHHGEGFPQDYIHVLKSVFGIDSLTLLWHGIKVYDALSLDKELIKDMDDGVIKIDGKNVVLYTPVPGERFVCVVSKPMAFEHYKALLTPLLPDTYFHIFDNVKLPIMVNTLMFEIVYINEAMDELLKTDAIGKKCYDVLHGLTQPPDFCPHHKVVKNRMSDTVIAGEIFNIGGHYVFSVKPLDIAGKVVGTVHILVDITEVIESRNRIAHVRDIYDAFLNILIHDVRKAIHGIMVLDQTQSHEYMDYYIEGILDKIENIAKSYRNLEFVTSPVSLKPYIMNAYDEVVALNHDRNIDLYVKIPEFKVMGNDMLDHVFFNLIENSVHVTEGNVMVEIEGRVSGDNLKLIIKNNGPPISPDDEVVIFKKFHSRRGSTGLGLYLSKKLLNLLGGDITIENGVFVIFLPLAFGD